MIALIVLACVVPAMWLGQTVLLRVARLPIRWRLDVHGTPPWIRAGCRAVTQLSLAAAILIYPRLIGRGVIEYYGQFFARGSPWDAQHEPGITNGNLVAAGSRLLLPYVCRDGNGVCVATEDADCKKAEQCSFAGKCSLMGNVCIAATDADCAGSEVCRTAGQCSAVMGTCAVQ